MDSNGGPEVLVWYDTVRCDTTFSYTILMLQLHAVQNVSIFIALTLFSGSSYNNLKFITAL